MFRNITVIILILWGLTTYSQTTPKREFRGAWVATVVNLDWPASGSSPATQQNDLKKLFDSLQANNINAVVFQIRSESDAFYNSPYEPWSYWLTNSQGTPPNPYYDPLEFAVNEAHKRGMELHAWFNPYRAERQVGNYTTAANHVTNQHPDWVIQIGTIKFLNPGMAQVRAHVTKIISDVVRRYDVDGVHMDDYFYPYPPNGITVQDTGTFRVEGRGFSDINDWRRDNVNILIKAINDSIKSIKPYVKMGMSPFGIWKSGVPSGISGLSAYSEIYCDAINWLQRKSIDYLTPQLYWKIGGSQDYDKLSKWWADSCASNGRHFYPGQAIYQVSTSTWTGSEIPNQIRINRANPKTGGSVFFRAYNLIENPKGLSDSLKTNVYKYPSLPPVMNWLDTVKPNGINNIRFAQVPGKGIAAIQWDKPTVSGNDDCASKYAVYRFDHSIITPDDISGSQNLYRLTSEKIYQPQPSSNVNLHYFAVSPLDHNNNEGPISSVVSIEAPGTPSMVAQSSTPTISDSISIVWNYGAGATSYRLQIQKITGTDSTQVFDIQSIGDTVSVVKGFEGEQNYRARVASYNPVGNSVLSNQYLFKTGFPAAVTTIYPVNANTNISRNPVIQWALNPIATKYQLQVSTTTSFDAGTVKSDTVINGAIGSAQVFGLNALTIYSYRVRAYNTYGWGKWSTVVRFKTTDATDINSDNEIPKEFTLSQNYPNPFNPSTIIEVSLNKSGFTELKVYDILGREISVLVSRELQPGIYRYEFSANNLAGGIYFYELRQGAQRITKKMILVK